MTADEDSAAQRLRSGCDRRCRADGRVRDDVGGRGPALVAGAHDHVGDAGRLAIAGRHVNSAEHGAAAGGAWPGQACAD
jgi:hypothetical protein